MINRYILLLLLQFNWYNTNAIKYGTFKKNELLSFPILDNNQLQQTKLTLDANWRWIHKVNEYTNCFNNNWDPYICPNPDVCYQNCLIEGVELAEYKNIYGITLQNNGITLKYVTVGQYGINVGSRLYLLDSTGQSYYGINPLNKELSFDVDVSKLGCGLNGAVYTVELPLNGVTDEAGPSYGIGYGDAQSPKDIKYVDGKPNIAKLGVSAFEFDIAEINNQATQMAVHNCKNKGVVSCDNPTSCGNDEYRYSGPCDADGGYYNPYQSGNRTLYGFGKNFVIDTSRPFTIKTQFITDDKTDNGNLVEIRRFYIQDGKKINGGSLTDNSISKSKSLFGEINYHQTLGGLKALSDSFKRKHVLVISLWDDSSPSQMRWLDGTYPPGSTALGSQRGPCLANNRDPATLRQQVPNSQVTYSNFALKKIENNMPLPSLSPSLNIPTPSPTNNKVPSYPPSIEKKIYWRCDVCVPFE